MNYLHHYKIRKNIMGLLLLVVMFFGTYAAFADTLKDALSGESSSLWFKIAPFSGYIALGAIILYIPLNILDKRLYEKALKENKDKRNNSSK
ncbi:hypothetical protein TSL6_19370 [Sulfurovum sp. TSL6]|uniref:hypothetical protein n=1 Tax=Sulfurovum sp. TSL6 TaxID=2826995 RepID=UPI001CC5F237|nr:hypothetical protein [Sulfurovum sp. TSL6]GIU01431.1 hypothetical protein TSL6_19370 [Sulfurovum sp. TSL6]